MENEIPKWLPNNKPKNTRSPRNKKGQFIPGTVPNPTGRPKGSVGISTTISRALREDSHEVVAVVKQAALDGDMQAAALILNRVCPPIKAHHTKVNFRFNPEGTLSDNVSDILKAVSEGHVPADIAKSIIESLGALAVCRQTDELERRLTVLESIDGT